MFNKLNDTAFISFHRDKLKMTIMTIGFKEVLFQLSTSNNKMKITMVIHVWVLIPNFENDTLISKLIKTHHFDLFKCRNK